MKIITPKITTALLLVLFLVGFVNVADAAFAGKKAVSKTEAVAQSNTDVYNAITSLEAPVPAPSTSTLLLVIIALFIPPLAIYLLYEEIGTPFWVNLVLTLLFFIPGVIHALIHILR
jgi:uncharacterized membrane protein YqaE (UPF0057 family)